MSDPAKKRASSGLSDAPSTSGQDRNQRTLSNLPPCSDSGEGEMIKMILKIMEEQKMEMVNEMNLLNQKVEEQKVELDREKKLTEKLHKQVEDLEERIHPEDPNLLYRKLGGETKHFSFIDSLTEGVEKYLKEKITKLEAEKKEMKGKSNAELEEKLQITKKALIGYKEWVENGKSKRYKKMGARVAAGGGAGLVAGGAATAAVHAALLIGSKAALAKAGVAGVSIGIAAGPACAIVFGCIGAGVIVVLVGYGVWWGYRKNKLSKAPKQPNKDDLIKQLAESFIFKAKAKKQNENRMAEEAAELEEVVAAINLNFAGDVSQACGQAQPSG